MQKIARVQNFKKDGMGLFIHFGLYSLIEKGEWYQEMYKLKTNEYYEKFKDFSNIKLKLNVKKIVSFAKENGFKYIVLTTKHHDGFALYDSKNNSDIDITKTKSNDIVKEFVDECAKQNIKAFLYYATWDWSQKSYKNNFEKYLDYVYKNVEFLVKNYKPVSGFWFDGNWSNKKADWKEERLYKMLRDNNPELIIINNSGIANSGVEQNHLVDSITFEQGLLKPFDFSKFSRDLAAETSQTFNDHWGYALEDYNCKSISEIIKKFLLSRKNKINYLLNMSINKDGELIPIEVETIKVFKRWLDKYAKPLLGDYEVVCFREEDFVIKTKEKYFIYLYNIISGGHVNKIHYGGENLEKRIFEINGINKVNNIKYVDNNCDVKYKLEKNKLIIEPKNFEYGFNTLVRVIELEVD